MILGVIVQQPSDKLDYDIDCTSLFNGDNDTLDTAQAVFSPAGTLIPTAVVSNDTTAKLWIEGGVDGDVYIVEVTVTSTAGRIKQDEFEVRIEETD